MKRLTLIRHAKSSWDNYNISDHDRPLNERGFRDAPVMAQMMVQNRWRPQLLVSSTAMRAKTTAAYFADALGIRHADIVLDERIYEAHTHAISYLIAELDDRLDDVALFGHNPGFSMLALQLSNRQLDSDMPTCAVAVFEADVDSWRDFTDGHSKMTGFFTPKNPQ